MVATRQCSSFGALLLLTVTLLPTFATADLAHTNTTEAPRIAGIPLGIPRDALVVSCAKQGAALRATEMFDAEAGRMVRDPDTLELDTKRSSRQVYALMRNDHVWLIEENREVSHTREAFVFETQIFGHAAITNSRIQEGLHEYLGKGWAGEFTWSRIPPRPCRAAVWVVERQPKQASQEGRGLGLNGQRAP